jgi:predicted short-subunit dehydrogenase-like oxidoreductase (DUF2520 family)
VTGPIGIAGAGRLAQALGRVLKARGAPVAAVASRNAEHAAAAAAFIGGDAQAVSLAELPRRATRILIAVSDDALADVALALAQAGMGRGIALHTCGARGPEILEPLAQASVACGVLHPLQTIATPEQGVAALPASTFAISGDAAAVEWGAEIVALADGHELRIQPESMPLYHAAAVMASNNVIGLIDAAVILMKAAGIGEQAALAALSPLIRNAVENASTLGCEKALTGPVRRGDVETLRRHLSGLAAVSPVVAGLYRAAGLQVLDLARRCGLAGAAAREIEALLREGR